MSFFQWNESLSVGISQIDQQHKKLVELVNQLFTAMSEGKGNDVLDKVLAELVGYTRSHFSTEERLMQQHGYPALAAHQSEHKAFTDKVGVMVSEFKSGKVALSNKVSAFLRDWLKGHIMGTDKKYAPFLQEKGVR